jgi:hypothetical protein
MNEYEDAKCEWAKRVSKIWSETKTKTEIESELYHLLILLPLGTLKEINKETK